jgi:hypothetical protein
VINLCGPCPCQRCVLTLGMLHRAHMIMPVDPSPSLSVPDVHDSACARLPLDRTSAEPHCMQPRVAWNLLSPLDGSA